MKPPYKTVYVEAPWLVVGEEQEVEVPTGTITTSLFGGEKPVTKTETQWVETGESDCRVDGEQLAALIEEQLNALHREAYQVHSVLPVISGDSEQGFSFTEGVIVVACQARPVGQDQTPG